MSKVETSPNLGPILGTKADDTLSVDTSVSFTWVPEQGNSFDGWYLYDDGQEPYGIKVRFEMGQSTASGSVTFYTPSSKPLDTAAASSFNFNFTKYGGADLNLIQYSNFWTWDPGTGVLDPLHSGASYDDVIIIDFAVEQAHIEGSHYPDGFSSNDRGHWALVDNPIDTEVFGGVGNDTIYGGQGHEVLFGEAGDDVIYVGHGDDVVFGGQGHDVIHGGFGTQVLDGGAGNDTIWGGSGAQTILGGGGRDTLWGGRGEAYLNGGAGADILRIGAGHETLVGGAGRDSFEVGTGASGEAIIADFHIREDVLRVAPGFGGLAVARPHDLAAHISVGDGGAAVLHLGSLSVTLVGLSTSTVTSHLQQMFKID